MQTTNAALFVTGRKKSEKITLRPILLVIYFDPLRGNPAHISPYQIMIMPGFFQHNDCH